MIFLWNLVSNSNPLLPLQIFSPADRGLCWFCLEDEVDASFFGIFDTFLEDPCVEIALVPDEEIAEDGTAADVDDFEVLASLLALCFAKR